MSNLGGVFGSSQLAEEITIEGREAMADFFNADLSEVSFGQNMTSITFAVSRALPRQWGLAASGLYVWSGHYYALNALDRLGLLEAGLVRIGFVDYNTLPEVDRALEALSSL